MAMHAGDKFSRLAGLLAMITCSMAITLAAHEPPPGLDENAYLLTLTWAFFAGAAGNVATVCVSDNPHTCRAAGRKLVLAALGPLTVVVGLTAASLL
jgi:hypothetical protein